MSIYLLMVYWWVGPYQSTNVEPANDLIVHIVNIKEGDGVIVACLSNNRDDFMKVCELEQFLNVESTDSIVELKFQNLSLGEYALAVFQDLNENKKLDRGLFKLPREPFGFSNNPSMIFGPPGYHRCAFTLDSLNTEITIRLLHL